jgi:hypothetical protein
LAAAFDGGATALTTSFAATRGGALMNATRAAHLLFSRRSDITNDTFVLSAADRKIASPSEGEVVSIMMAK